MYLSSTGVTVSVFKRFEFVIRSVNNDPDNDSIKQLHNARGG